MRKRRPRICKNLDMRNFHTTFQNSTMDVLYCHLNEIDPDVVDGAGGSLIDSDDFDDQKNFVYPIDPRVGSCSEQVIFDWTSNTKPKVKIFNKFPTKSKLPARIHASCFRVLQAIQSNKEAFLNDIKYYYLNEQNLIEEKKAFLEFVKDYEISNKSNSSEVMKVLSKYYMSFRRAVAEEICSKPNHFYTLSTALPLEKIITTDKLNLQSPVLQYRKGYVPEYEENITFANLLRYCPDDKETINKPLKLDVNKESFESKDPEGIDIFIPEDTFCLLLESVNEFTDFWEVPVEIKTAANLEKSIEFDEPLPIRYQNIEENYLLFEKFIDNVTKISTNSKLLNLTRDGSSEIEINSLKSEVLEEELHAVDLNREYTVFEHDEYIRKVKCKNSKYDGNEILTKLVVVNEVPTSEENCLRIFCKSKYQYFKKDDNNHVFVNVSYKLEHKSEFGAEVMTLNQLIREWIRQFFRTDSITERIRIDANSGKKIMQQTLTTKDIESEMQRLYNINICDLMNPVFRILKLLNNFPFGQYMLIYNLKCSNKIMVYAKTDENTSSPTNTISLHDLYRDDNIMENICKISKYIPIDDKVITPMHVEYKIVPCCFPPWGVRRYFQQNDRQKVVQNAIEKKEMDQIRKSTFMRRKKAAKKMQKRKLRRMLRRKEKAQSNQLKSSESVLDTAEVGGCYDDVEMPEFISKKLPDSITIPNSSTISQMLLDPGDQAVLKSSLVSEISASEKSIDAHAAGLVSEKITISQSSENCLNVSDGSINSTENQTAQNISISTFDWESYITEAFALQQSASTSPSANETFETVSNTIITTSMPSLSDDIDSCSDSELFIDIPNN